MSRRFSVVVVCLLAGCAARGPSPQVLAEMARAESLLRAGCYTCLREAFTIYQREAASPRAPLGAAQGAFDTALLIAIREKELGIPVLRLPASIPASSAPVAQDGSRAQNLLAAFDLIVGDTSGFDPEQRAVLTGRGRPPVAPDNTVRRALDGLVAADLTTAYVALTIDCESSRLIESVDMAGLTAKYAGIPLMQFRLARCGQPVLAPRLTSLRAADPRFTDTLYWEARRALIGSPQTGIDFPAAFRLFGQARAAFPASLMITMAWANASISAEEFEAALAGFDEVLAVYPTHRDALIGRVTALSYLMRHADAIASATQLLELGTWHIGDANYWRAWNRYNLEEYDRAWQDVENAIKGLSNTRVYTLAGMIAYARKELPVAIQRFDRAYEIDSSNCDATWMSGLASIDLEELAIAAPKFTRGMSCFVSAAAALRQDAARVEAQVARRGTPATARETRQIERAKRDADNADERSAQSAFNAAQCYARTGAKAMALNLVDAAIAHPRMAEKAVALKAAIEKLPK